MGDFARSYDETVRGMSSHFVWLNRSKESLTLDLKHPEAPTIMERLLAGADIFVQNLAPGAAQRLGLGPAELTARHPRLIVCGISGYDTDGPYRDQKAYDLSVQCEVGLVAVTGTEDGPAKAGISAADPQIVEGQIHGGLAQGIAQALYEEAVYDEAGNLVTGSLLDYYVPSAADLPDFVTDRTETPATTNPLGAKGVGEAGTIASTPAVVNAIVDALRHLGVTDVPMPCTPERIWRALQDVR